MSCARARRNGELPPAELIMAILGVLMLSCGASGIEIAGEETQAAVELELAGPRHGPRGAPKPQGAALSPFERHGGYPLDEWSRASPAAVGMDGAKLEAARDYALTGEGSGYITRHGKLVMAWGPPRQRYDLKSTTKSIGVTAVGLALMDGKLRLDDKARLHQPALGADKENAEAAEADRAAGWLDGITLEHLATQTAGFDKPGGYARLLFEPGTKWFYSDSGPNWLAECLTLAYKVDLQELMFERVFTPLGIARDDLAWRKNAYRPAMLDGVMRREFGSGISANVDAMARIGYLYLRRGQWRGRQLIPESFVDRASRPVAGVAGLPGHDPEKHGNASDHYGLLWWNNADGALENAPRDAYWSWGLYDSLIVVVPSLDIVVARAGRSWRRNSDRHYDVLRPFLEPIAASVQTPGAAPPYPQSPVIKELEWDPADTIMRKAEGSDNWPATWADDGKLYTAYGDGWGFVPKTAEKLSLGLAAVDGPPRAFIGTNIRSPSAEQKGGGPAGKKASGLLMVDGVLYMWVRNARNAQLAWSRDHAKTWTWANWRFSESFGCPSFLNFGKNHQGARDGHVYVYSQDSDSAYEPSDATVLARAPKDRLRNRGAYEFFVRLDKDGAPVWSSDVTQRGPVLANPGRCYRTTASYSPSLDRYLLCQLHAGIENVEHGGFGIFDAPEPWGPWTTAFYTEAWDIGPGETASLPTKWMNKDGKDLWLIFSGGDSFSVRGAQVRGMSETHEEGPPTSRTSP